VRQVGHLPELYEDARSEKYKIVGEACLLASGYLSTRVVDGAFLLNSLRRNFANLSRHIMFKIEEK